MLRISSVEPLGGYNVRIELTDGSTRVLNLLPMLQGPRYRPLLDDVTLFRSVGVVHGTLAWASGQDLDPDVLLDTEISRATAHVHARAAVVVSQFDGMIAYICPNGRVCPHLLVVLEADEARVGISDGEVLEGALPAPKLNAIQTWLRTHRAAMALAWVKAVGTG